MGLMLAVTLIPAIAGDETVVLRARSNAGRILGFMASTPAGLFACNDIGRLSVIMRLPARSRPPHYMKDTLLSAHDICLIRKGNTILQGVSLDIVRGEITTLIGPNGAGKTSLVRCLLGLEEINHGSMERSPQLAIGYVPQSVSIPDELPMRVRDFLQLSCAISLQRMRDALQELEVEGLIDSPVQSVSGGEMQRILLARALLKQPDVLVLDEPAQGLDVIGQQSLYRNIREIRDRYDCAILMVSHDLHLVMAATDKVICLNSHVCCSGHPDDISDHPEYIKLFGSAVEGLAVYTHHHDHEHDVHGNIIGDNHAAGDHSGCSHD